jgi:hypothetical protein
MAGILQAKKYSYVADMEGFWLYDKCRIIADIRCFDSNDPPPFDPLLQQSLWISFWGAVQNCLLTVLAKATA